MMDQKLIEQITQIVLKQLQENNATNITADTGNFSIKDTGIAEASVYPDEVVIGLAPGFSVSGFTTICGLAHKDVLLEVAAGIEEEGMRARFIRVMETSDVSFIAKKAAVYSGSGIGIGLQTKGTAVIHQKDLFPLTNLELFPQAPLITLEIYRKIGKNAARYAKGQTPIPIETVNDFMVRPKYQTIAAIMHIKETESVNKTEKPHQLEVSF